MKTLHAILTAALLPTLPACAQEKPAPAKTITPGANISLKNEIEHAISRGLKFLAKQQQPEGYWSDSDHPALTALPVLCLLGDPTRAEDAPFPATVEKGLEFILSKVQSDDGIYGKGLGNYNTSLCTLALTQADRAEYLPVILKARNFIIDQQHDRGKRGEADNPFDGGIGYGSRWSHSDLSNTHLGLEAIYYTKHLVADQPGQGLELDWDAAVQFITRCQNLPSHNDQEWADDSEKNEGGFIYFPGASMADKKIGPDGKEALRSYGSMSYAGLLAYIYADLKQDDPRVKAVLKWLKKNFSLKQNPGMGPQGLFYYYHTMAKALAITGVEELELADGTKVNWRHELAKELFNLQKQDGSWFNENGRWWEMDPVLVSSYALLTLERIHASL